MLNNEQEKLVCIFGLGQSGLATARYLQRINKKFAVIDSRINPPGKNEVAKLSCCQKIILGKVEQTLLNQAEAIILSPGITPALDEIKMAKKLGVSVIGDIEVFVQNTKNKIIAITGSNGKSTVTDLTCRILRAGGYNAQIGGNFGIPVLDYLPEDNVDFYVLELSSFQLDTTYSLKAEVAVVLNITEDHMDRYDSFIAYSQSKLSIYNQTKLSLVNLDDALTKKLKSDNHCSFSLNNKDANFYLEKNNHNYQLIMNGQALLNTNELSITGKHNWSNLLASLGLISSLNIKITDSMLSEIKDYKGLAHRYQLVMRKNLVDWVNDSKATNVGATKAALENIDDDYSFVILIAGGDAKGANLLPLKDAIENKVSQLILMGKDAIKIANLVNETKVTFVHDMKQAVKIAQSLIKKIEPLTKKALVLLSPACASFDMFNNFEERGQAFIDVVEVYS